MALMLTLKNTLAQVLQSDKYVAAVLTTVNIQAEEEFSILNTDMGPTMVEQFTNGVLQQQQSAPAQTEGQGFVAAVDFTAVGDHLLLSVGAGERFAIDKLKFVVDDADTVTVVPEVSVGITGPNYEDLRAQAPLTGFDTLNETFVDFLDGIVPTVVGPADIYARVRVGATAVTLEGTIWVMGTGDPITP